MSLYIALHGSERQCYSLRHVFTHHPCPTLCNPVTVAYQAPPSMEFPRQGYWSGLPFLLQGIFLTQGTNPGLMHCRQMLYPLSHQGSPSLGLNPQKRKSTCCGACVLCV